MRLLIAEDDPRLLKSLVKILEMNKYVVDGVSNGNDALDYALSEEYDGIILDIMMPGKNGIEVLREIRQKNVSTPVLFLTARTEVEQRVEGLDAGADDYLSKPFATNELLARIRAMIRRKDNFVPDLLSYGKLVLNRSTYELICEDQSALLSGKEFQIMEMFLQQPNVVISTEQLITHIWGWNTDVDISVVWVHISNIRKKLAVICPDTEIKFIRNCGYILGTKK